MPYTPPRPPRTSERLWSEEVRLAEAAEEPKPVRDTAYQFSNGRKFVEASNPYTEPDVPA
jgi:hypothetical protein